MRDRRRAALVLATGLVILANTDVSHATATWSGNGSTGGSGTSASLIDPNNWVGGVVPAFGTNGTATTAADDAVFTGTKNLTITVPNDGISRATDAIFRNLTFDANAGAFVFIADGSPEDEMVFNYPTNGVLTENDSPNPQTFNNSTAGIKKGTLNAAAGDFVFNTATGFSVGNGTRTAAITFTGAHNIYFNTGFQVNLTNKGVVSDTDAVKTGTGTMFIGTPTGVSGYWAGAMFIGGGTVQINNNNSLGANGLPAAGQQTEISSAAGTLALTNNITVGEYINLDGRAGTTAHIVNVSGDNVLNGTIASNALSGSASNFVFQSDGTAPTDLLEINDPTFVHGFQQNIAGNATIVLKGAGNGSITAPFYDSTTASWSIDKTGTGKWTLNSPTGYSGNTIVEQGTLAIANTTVISLTPVISVKSGGILDVTGAGGYQLSGAQTLKGSGTVAGTITAGGSSIISPGDGGAGTLTIGSLSLNDGSVLQYDLSNSTSGANDKISVGGNLSLSGTTSVSITKTNGSLATGVYRLLDYIGSLSGDSTNFSLVGLTGGTTRQTFAVDTTVAHQVNLNVSGSAASLTWVGGSNSNAWDVHSTVNFTGAPGATPDNHFYNGDTVTFSDAGSTTPVTNVVSAVAPGALTFTNSTGHTYKISGGDIAVASDLTTTGSGDVTFVNAGLMVGGNVVAGGSGTLSITNSGATSFVGSVTTSGSRGVNIANSGNQPVTIGGNLTVGGSSSLNVSGGGALSVGGNFNSTTSGNVNFTNSDLSFGGGLSQSGTGTVTIANTGALTLPTSVSIASGTLALNRGDTISVGALTGNGTVQQQGSGTVILTGNNSGFGGAILVSSGTVQLGSTSVAPLGTAASATTVVSGATLDLNSRHDLGSNIVTIAGTGASGQLGALVDTSGSGTSNNVRTVLGGVILSGDATLAGVTNTFPYIQNNFGSTAAPMALFQGNGHNLTVSGPAEWDIEGAGETHLANITLKDNAGGDGTDFDYGTTLGDQPGVVTLSNEGTLSMESGGPVTKNIVVDSNGDGHGGILAYASNLTIASQVTINGTSLDTTVDAFPGGTLTGVTFTETLSGKVTGPGGLSAHMQTRPAGNFGVTALTSDANDFAGPIIVGGGSFGTGFGLITAANDKPTLSIGNGGTTGTLPGGDVTVNKFATLAFNVNKTFNVPNKISGAGNLVASAGAVTLTGNLSYTGATTVNGGLLRAVSSIATSSGVTVNTTGVFEAGSTQTLAALTINDGGRAQIGGGTKKILTVGSSASTAAAATIGGSGVLDVNNGELILPYAAGSSPIAAVVGYLASGFNVGSWNGAGINSSAAQNDTGLYTALGYSDDGSQVIVACTYYGDSDLSGTVTTTDFQMFLDGLAGNGSTWAQGDYTYDGKVDLGNDFNLFLTGYVHNGAALGDLAPIIAGDDQLSASQKASLLSVVPEPSSIAVMGLALTSLAARRRRKQ